VADLAELSYELVNTDTDRIYMGRGTKYFIETVEFGEPDINTNDTGNPREDGVHFGRDTKGGRSIVFEGNILTDPGKTPALDALNALETAWDGEMVRATPSGYSFLRMRRGDRIRRVYGRPRKFSSSSGTTQRGWIPFTAEFVTVDHLYYDDTEFQDQVSIVPGGVGGLEGELIGPIIASDATEGDGTIFVSGTKPAWLAYKIQGPIQYPVISVVDNWYARLNVTLAYDQYIVVDPSRWNRSVRRENGGNVAGAFTADSVRLSQMKVPPGFQRVSLSGVDPTGTASLTVYWRGAFSSY